MSQAESHWSDEEAIELASDFCRRIGAPVQPGPVSVCPVQETVRLGLRLSHYLPRLQVVFAEQAEIVVTDSAPLVCSYHNLALRNGPRRQPAEAPISESEALRIAEPIIQATRQANELLPDGTHLRELGTPLYADGFSWIVSWKRVFQGIPYHNQHANVRLQASSGVPKSVSVVFRSPPPADAVFQVTSEQAEDTARAMLSNWANAKESYPMPWKRDARRELLSCGVHSLAAELKIEVVQPNGLWPSCNQRLEFAPLPFSRVAWVCQISYGDEKSFTFWIDVKTGEVLGGETSGGPLGA